MTRQVPNDLATAGRLEEARIIFEGLVEGNPKDSASRAALGTVYQKLGRIDGVGKRFGGPKHSGARGWDLVHVAIDDHSRLAYVEQLQDEHGPTAAAFLERPFGSSPSTASRWLG